MCGRRRPDASRPFGGRRRIPLDDFVLRVDGALRQRPSTPTGSGAARCVRGASAQGGPAPAWGVAVVTLAVLFRERRARGAVPDAGPPPPKRS